MPKSDLILRAQQIILDENNRLQNKILKLENIQRKQAKLIIKLQSLPEKKSPLLFANHINEVIDILISEEYDKIILYNNFDIKLIFSALPNLMKKENTNILKYIIDNCLDINTENNSRYRICKRLIHIACRESNEEIIMYLINKNVKLNVTDYDDSYPLQIIFKYSTFSMVKYFMEKKINFRHIYGNKLWNLVNESKFTAEEKAELFPLIEYLY